MNVTYTYTCACCRRHAASYASDSDAARAGVCWFCLDLGAEEQEYRAEGAFWQSPASILRTIAEIGYRGGDASVWDPLKAQAIAALTAKDE